MEWIKNCSLIKGGNCNIHQEDKTDEFLRKNIVALNKLIDRLEAYEGADFAVFSQEYTKAAAEGRLVILPCKVGDIVYDIQDGTPYATRVLSFSYLGDHWACRTASSYPDLELFGERIFLTLEEAEAALRKDGAQHG